MLGMITFRIYQLQRGIRSTIKGKKYDRIISTMMESAAMYLTVLIIKLSLFPLNDHVPYVFISYLVSKLALLHTASSD